MVLERSGGFSVDLSLDQTIHKSGSKECELLLANKVATDLHQGNPSSSGVTHQDDAVVKAAARPEIFEAPDPGVNKIALEGLKNSSLWSHPQKSRCNPSRGAWDERAKRKDTSSSRDTRSFGSRNDGYVHCHQEGEEPTRRQA